MLYQSERDRSCCTNQEETDHACINQEETDHAAPIRKRQVMLHQLGRDRSCCTNQEEVETVAPIRKRETYWSNQEDVGHGKPIKRSIICSCAHQRDTIVLNRSGCCCNCGTNQEKVENVTPIRERQPSAGPIMKMYCRSYRANNCKWRQILLQKSKRYRITLDQSE